MKAKTQQKAAIKKVIYSTRFTHEHNPLFMTVSFTAVPLEPRPPCE